MDKFEDKCEFFREEEIRCPYCGKAVEDLYGGNEDNYEYKCEHCGKIFEISKEKTIVYTTYKKESKDRLHLCNECIFDFATCKTSKIKFGTGIGNDNVIMCSNFQSNKREEVNG